MNGSAVSHRALTTKRDPATSYTLMPLHRWNGPTISLLGLPLDRDPPKVDWRPVAAQLAARARDLITARPRRVLILGGLGAILFAIGLDTHEIGRDEAVSVLLVQRPIGEILALLTAHEPNPAGYFLLLHWWPHGTALEARLLSYLPAVLIPPLVFAAAHRLEISEWTAGLLAATSPFLAYYADEARMYAWLALFGAGALAMVAHILRRGEPAPAWLGVVLGAVLAGGMYLHYFAGFTGVAAVVALLAFRRPRLALIATGSAALLFLPGALMLMHQTPVLLQNQAGGWQPRTDAHAVQGMLSSLFAGSGDFPPAVAATPIFAVAALLALRRFGSPTIRLLVIFLAIGIVLPMTVGVFFRFLTPRYLSASVPALLLLTAAGLATLKPRLVWVAVGFLTLASIGLSLSAAWRYDGQKLPIREGLAEAAAVGAEPAVQGRIYAPPAAYYAPGKVAYAFGPPRVDYIGLYALPPGAAYPPGDGRPILFFDYCNQAPPALPGYTFKSRTLYPRSFCLDLETATP